MTAKIGPNKLRGLNNSGHRNSFCRLPVYCFLFSSSKICDDDPKHYRGERQRVKPLLLCLHGESEAGKDEFAKGLIKHGFKPYAFGDKLKEFAYATNPIITICDRVDDKLVVIRLQDYVDDHGWEEAKKHPEVRAFIQRVGTEGGQKVFGQKFWAKIIKKEIETNKEFLWDNKVVKDMRFPHEFGVMESVRRCNFYSILIEREDSQKHMTETNRRHISEQHRLPYHYKVCNYGTVEELHDTARTLLDTIKSEIKPELTQQ